MEKGWISLSRKIQDCWVWNDKPFSKGQAWIDLLLSANHEDKKFLLGNELILCERGSMVTSLRKLENRWGWSNTKTVKFLNLLENDGMIAQKKDTKKTVITIAKYGDYQNSEKEKTTEKRHDNDTSTTQKRTNNNDNNDNNVNKKDNKEEGISSITNYQQIADLYNNTCVSFPRINSMSEARKKAIKARLNSYSIEDIKEVFEKAEQSDFLKGKNDRNWQANFDWMMKDANIAKILDGNYENKKNQQPKKSTNKFNDFPQREYSKDEFDDLEKKMMNIESF